MKKDNKINQISEDIIEDIRNDYKYLNLRNNNSHWRSAKAHLMTFLSFFGLLVLVFTTCYFGIEAGIKTMDLNYCKDLKYYQEAYPESVVREQDITKCNLLGFNLE